MASSEAADNTVNAGDSLVGGAGADTLNINVAGSLAAVGAGLATSGIETLGLANNGSADVTVDGTLLAGLKTVKVTGGQNATTVNNLDGIVDLNLVSTSKNVTASSVAAATVGTADSAKVTLNAVARTGSVDVTYNGVEALNVATTGTASGSVKADGSVEYDVEFVGNALNTVTVTGTAGLVAKVGFNATAQTVTQVNTFDASALGAGITATIANTGVSGLLSVKGSASADTIDISGITVTEKVTVDGGAGDGDVLKTGTISAVTTGTQPGANITGFEVLSIAAGKSVDVSALGANTFVSATLNGAGTITKANSALVTINQVGSGNISYGRATDGTADALTINLKAPAEAFSGSITAAGEETITINSNAGAASTVGSLSAAAATKLVVTGAQDLSITTAATTVALATVDASALTGTTNVNATAFTLNAGANTTAMKITGSATGRNSITGGSAADSITGGSSNDTLNGGSGNDTMVGGAGNDSIVAGIGSDNIDGGDGNDTLNAGSGADTVTAGAGNDAIYVTGLSSGDSIDGGDGTDVLSTRAISEDWTVSDYVVASGSVAVPMKGVETAYIQLAATEDNVSAATAETLDLTEAADLKTLYLDVTDSVGADAHVAVKNFAGSSIVLSDTAAVDGLSIDGVGQTLGVTLRNYNDGTNTVKAVVTGVGNLTLTGESTMTTAAGVTTKSSNKIDAGVTASSVTGYALSTTGSNSTLGLNANALDVGAATVSAANTISLTAATWDKLTTGAITAGSEVNSLSITARDYGDIDGDAITMAGSSLSSSSLTIGTDADVSGISVAATSVGKLTASLGAGADASIAIAAAIGSGSTLAMQSGSTFTSTALGKAGETSSLTVTGSGGLEVALDGKFTLNASALIDANGIVVTSVNASGGDRTITGSNYADAITGGTGNDVITGGTGNDTLTGGGGNDVFKFARARTADGNTDTIVDYAAGDVIDVTGIKTILSTLEVRAGGDVELGGDDLGDVIVVKSNSTTAYAGTIAFDITGVDNAGGFASLLVNAESGGTLTGTVGAEWLVGGAGVQTITGGAGVDKITGGAGNDVFVYAAGDAGTTGTEVITDFKVYGANTTDVLDIAAAYKPSTSLITLTAASTVDVKGAVTGATSLTATVADGVITLSGADAALVDTVAELKAVFELLDVNNKAEVGVIQMGGSTYVLMDAASGAAGSADAVIDIIKLDGVTGVTAIGLTAAANTIVFA